MTDWCAEGARGLEALLPERGPDEPVWSRYTDRTSGFWVRMQMIEPAVHRWDAQSVTGPRPPRSGPGRGRRAPGPGGDGPVAAGPPRRRAGGTASGVRTARSPGPSLSPERGSARSRAPRPRWTSRPRARPRTWPSSSAATAPRVSGDTTLLPHHFTPVPPA
ncbi:maleylpyruvate isomerase N-terminal domain-containing protein [Streptomyces sp. NPDC055254]